MQEQLISFETAKLAKDKSFNEYTEEVYAETKEHEFEDYHTGEFRIFKYQPPRLLCKKYINSNDIEICNAPSQSLLQKWLREKYNIDITMHRSFSMTKSYHYCIIIDNDYENEIQQEVTPNRTYEEALEIGLQEALKLI